MPRASSANTPPRAIFKTDPFISLDIEGVGELVQHRQPSAGARSGPDLKLGICGEHGGDPASIAFCEKIGLDYVSCSPFRVPIARLAAAQASLSKKPECFILNQRVNHSVAMPQRGRKNGCFGLPAWLTYAKRDPGIDYRSVNSDRKHLAANGVSRGSEENSAQPRPARPPVFEDFPIRGAPQRRSRNMAPMAFGAWCWSWPSRFAGHYMGQNAVAHNADPDDSLSSHCLARHPISSPRARCSATA